MLQVATDVPNALEGFLGVRGIRARVTPGGLCAGLSSSSRGQLGSANLTHVGAEVRRRRVSVTLNDLRHSVTTQMRRSKSAGPKLDFLTVDLRGRSRTGDFALALSVGSRLSVDQTER